MLKYLILPPLAAVAVTAAANAQPRKRDDLLDTMTRHIQLCADITDSQMRLACYDKLPMQLGDAPTTTPQPTPLRPGQAPTAGQQAAQPGSPTPLAPPPLQVPGGGPATLGGQVQAQNLPPSQTGMPANPDAAFNPNAATNTYRPPEGVQPKPQPVVRRTGPRPIPNFSTPQPLVTLAATNLTYGEARYWQVTIVITSNTPRALDTQVSCTFLNAGRSVGEAYFGPIAIQPGEQITTDLIGPSTTVYVDATRCNVLSPT